MRQLETQLTKHVNHFLHTGVYVKERDVDQDILSQSYMAKFVKAVASEAGMAYIYATVNDNHVHLVFPQRGRLHVVLSPLIVLGKKQHDKYSARNEPGVNYIIGETQTVFNFVGEDAVKHFTAWLNRCASDYVFKVALKTA